MPLEESKKASNVMAESMGLGSQHPEPWLQHGVDDEPKELLRLAQLKGQFLPVDCPTKVSQRGEHGGSGLESLHPAGHHHNDVVHVGKALNAFPCGGVCGGLHEVGEDPGRGIEAKWADLECEVAVVPPKAE